LIALMGVGIDDFHARVSFSRRYRTFDTPS